MKFWNILRPWLKKIKFGLEVLAYPIFLMRGRLPYTFGYQAFKRWQIIKNLPPACFEDKISQNDYGVKVDERVVEYPWLLSHLPEGPGRLLDAGSALNHDFLLQHPRLAGKEIFISTLAPESYNFWNRGISYVYEDLRTSCFRDSFFDWIICLSTLEHIGLDNCMLYTGDASKNESHEDDYLLVVRELCRMLKPGGRLYLTVPYGRSCNHGWFQVFDAMMIKRLREILPLTGIKESYFKYQSDGWHPSTPEELTGATFFDIHAARRLDQDMAAGARGLVCLEVAT